MASGIVWRPDPAWAAATNWSAFIAAAGMPDYDSLAARASHDPEWFWRALIDWLDFRFDVEPNRILDLSNGIAAPRWCAGARTNIVANILDRLDGTARARPAMLWSGENGALRQWSYAELDAETSRLAAGLAALGYGEGDVIGFYLPMLPETAAAFLACAKLGCIVLPLFSGFGPDAIAERVSLGGATAILTADATRRRGELLPLKATLDAALPACPSVRHVVVLRDKTTPVAMQPGRDVWWHDLVAGRPARHPTASLPAEHPLMVIYTSGTTGRPKGAVHTHLGLGVKIGQDTRLSFDLKPGDRMLWPTDFGWFGGTIQFAGCLLANAACVLVEGQPTWPTPDRLWSLAARHRVTHFGTAPTLARILRRDAADPAGFDLSALRIIFSTGEAWDEESWRWVFDRVGGGRLPIVNFSGGTEMDGIVATNILEPIKPGSFNGGIPGTGADIVDEAGQSVPPGVIGELVMREACIGTTRGLWRDPDRFHASYWSQNPGMWTQGDLASRDEDGFWFLHGRSDDTIKVSGKRIGPTEIETALIATGHVAEAAAVAIPDPLRGQAVCCVVVPLAEPPTAAQLAEAVAAKLGSSFRPARIVFVADLPKTRSMKVMRRVIRAVLAGTPTGDLASLTNPDAVAALAAAVKETAP